jgi:hypothetical protein
MSSRTTISAERDDAGIAFHFRVNDEACSEAPVQCADIAQRLPDALG